MDQILSMVEGKVLLVLMKIQQIGINWRHPISTILGFNCTLGIVFEEATAAGSYLSTVQLCSKKLSPISGTCKKE